MISDASVYGFRLILIGMYSACSYLYVQYFKDEYKIKWVLLSAALYFAVFFVYRLLSRKIEVLKGIYKGHFVRAFRVLFMIAVIFMLCLGVLVSNDNGLLYYGSTIAVLIAAMRGEVGGLRNEGRSKGSMYKNKTPD